MALRMPVVTVSEVKRNIGGIDDNDTYFDSDISLYIGIASEYLTSLIEEKEKVNQNIARLCIIVMATELFNHKQYTDDINSLAQTNELISSLLINLRY